MCGITGYATLDPRRVGAVDLRAMNDALAHRGPDDEGLHVADGYGLAQRRLAILDLTPAGHQPMEGPAGTWITFNGEIYNFHEIADELAAHGVGTRTRCDTEVMLLALHQWGLEGALRRFNGMFAFGLWDPSSRTLTLARDHLGVKPMYYYADSECIVFASELRALERWSGMPRAIDHEAVDLYIAYEHVPAPWTMWRGVRKLEPGSWLQWRDGVVTTRRWWELEYTGHIAPARSLDDWAEECRARLRRATELRMISDAPLGALLSGGIDSSAVVGLMADLGHTPKTFSIGFDDASYNEVEFARMVAASPELTLEVLERAFDEPLADVSLIPTYAVSRMARRHVTVVISGDGGDEVFAGYDWYRAAALADRYARIPGPVRWAVDAALRRVPPTAKKKGLVNKLKRFSEGVQGAAGLEHLAWLIHAHADEKLRLYRGPLSPLAEAGAPERLGRSLLDAARAVEPLSRRQWVDIALWLPDDILAKVDRASMAVALEARSPFLDYEVAEFAARLPASMHLDGGVRKRVLRHAIRPLVPAEILTRPKEGFSMPMKHWLRGELQPMMRDLLTSSSASEWFDTGECTRLMDEHVSGRFNHAHLLWTLVVLQRWRERSANSGALAEGAA
ncbi:MAG: asparagine synthase (glutamine-hydrolyzing) [Chloroflexi bacterium]|nr:MAG: asparagine synthase (glutamine-hydrolyzing) [Chloroflexota bacterium]